MIRLTLAALALLLLPQDFDKSRHPWLKWKTGSFTRLKMSVEGGGQQMEVVTRQELTASDAKEFTLAVATEAGGQTQESETVEAVPTKDGEETIKVGDKEYKCTIWKAVRKRNNRENEMRYWMADGVDTPLKFSNKGGGDDGEFVAVKLGEELTVAGKKVSCAKLEGTLKGRMMGDMKGSFWFSADVPGGAVKFALEGEKGKMSAEVVEFDGKK